MVVRITPFSERHDLDRELGLRGYGVLDDTRVMVCPLINQNAGFELPTAWSGCRWNPNDLPMPWGRFAAQRRSSVGRTPVGWCCIRCSATPAPFGDTAMARCWQACAQFALEGEIAGLYEVVTRASDRGRGFAPLLCEGLLRQASLQGARVAYLQVETDNRPARRLYDRLGFRDAYAYHYRTAPPRL